MTREKDEIQITNRIVATMDICSSSRIIEDLLKTENIKVWRDLLIEMKQYLITESPKYGAEIYKFIGDGWIILFAKPYSGKKMLKLLSGLYQRFEKYYNEKVFPMLDTPPEIYGLTFGLDEGRLIQLIMQGKREYIGRPINIACRLQGVINEIDIKGGFRVFMSHRLFNSLKRDFSGYYNETTERPLRNISEGSNFKCYRLPISDIPFRIVEARYGTSQNSIDVTFQYTKNIKNGKLDVVVSNQIAENDPHRDVSKILKIKFFHKGKLYEREFKEGSRIQLP
jgi:class 3 adenylate cyclase